MPRGKYVWSEQQRINHRLSAQKRTKSLEERFWSKVDKRGPDDCWLWKGSLHEDGYGQIYMDGRTQRAHRASLRVHGVEPPPYDGGTGQCPVVDHICKEPACVNPAHLRIVSQADNCVILAGEGSPYRRNKLATHCVHGHEFTPENTAIQGRNGRPGRICLTCYPGNWRRAVVPRERPAKALTPEQYEKRFGRRDPSA